MFRIPVSKEYIFSICDEEEIFSHYGIPITNNHFCSPFRNDHNPTCSIIRIRGKLYFRDWAVHDRSLDVIDLVEYIYNCDYHDALYHIYEDLKLGNKPVIEKDYTKVNEKSGKSNITVDIQPFTIQDKSYLGQYGITQSICDKFRAYSLQRVYLNNQLFHVSSKSDPAIGYYFGNAGEDERWKIYFYKRSTVRFICNTNRIQGWIQIPKQGDNLIITKSLKDVMTLYRLGYWSIAPQMENFQFYDEIIENLKDRFKNIYLLYDNDKAGKIYSEKFTQLFDIPHFFVKEEKDISDYVKENTLLQAKQFIKTKTYDLQ